ncbi:outer membrane lipoprotein carrier protein LolA [Danxiaibacter flavus]|uniref:Outer membrane lipoprotein carrier protein LolA n=1 Tax=Danxiaibacter flavus TaxID=3049108 RepID=A0ABV3ZHE2_9BACT|nr:outer membrane lipoprotein carrier protein LolA [Chitinophagaceae bacterium DXS]
MKKFYLLLTVFLGLGIISQAQNDANAKKILDGVSAKLKTLKGVTANFSYTTRDKKNVKKGSVNGLISFKGQQYYIKQGSTEIFCNGTKTWNYNGESEVTVSDVDNDNKTLTPQKLLSNFYDKDFTYKLVSSAGAFSEIQMIPVDSKKNFKQVNVFVDKSKNMITKAHILDKSDNTIDFSLSNINTNASLPDNKFVFDAAKHPGVEVITN